MSDPNQTHEFYMQQALVLADEAERQGEVPVGALLVHHGRIIGRGFNQVITQLDPSAHAEMLAIRDAAQTLQNYRILDTTLYVTLEPCPMCAGALVHGRVKQLVYGASDPRTGACGSVFNVVADPRLNHQLEVIPGILAEQCGERLSAFFRQRRAAQKALKKAAQNFQSPS